MKIKKELYFMSRSNYENIITRNITYISLISGRSSKYRQKMYALRKVLCKKCELEIKLNTPYKSRKGGGATLTKHASYYHPDCYDRQYN